MTKEKDNSDAPPPTAAQRAAAVSPGRKGQKPVPSGQLRGIPTSASTPCTRMGSQLRRLRQDERGAGTVELVIAMPVLLLAILLIAQFALYLHATHIAQSAASHALSATRVHGGSAAAGDTAAQRVLSQLGSGPLREPSVTAHRGADHASVTITGTAISVLPFVTFTVHAEAVGPVEEFTESR
jgi:hypothetical protein